jgi:hypothetical protein
LVWWREHCKNRKRILIFSIQGRGSECASGHSSRTYLDVLNKERLDSLDKTAKLHRSHFPLLRTYKIIHGNQFKDTYTRKLPSHPWRELREVQARLRWARTDLQQRQGARFEMFVRIAQVRTLNGENGEAREPHSRMRTGPNMLRSLSNAFTNSSRTQYSASLRVMRRLWCQQILLCFFGNAE